MMRALFLLFAVAMAAAQEATVLRVANPIPDSYIIKLKTDVDVDVVTSSVKLAGGRVGLVYRNAFHGFSAHLTDKLLDWILLHPGVEYVEEDGVVEAMSVGSWGLDRIDQRNLPLDNSYTPSGTGSTYTAYVIDTGVYSEHVEFGVDRASMGYVYPGGTNTDCSGHGTHMSGTVGSTTYGVATGVKLIGVKVLNCFGSGSTSYIIGGIDWAQQDAARKNGVAMLAIGGGASSSLDTAVRNLVNSGVVTSVAAGNSNADACNFSPAREPSAITVGASTQTDAVRSSSNYGSCLDIFAPGTDITSTWIGNPTATATLSGSSCAAAHVAGAAALYNGNSALLLSSATNGVLSGVPANTPNLLLYVS